MIHSKRPSSSVRTVAFQLPPRFRTNSHILPPATCLAFAATHDMQAIRSNKFNPFIVAGKEKENQKKKGKEQQQQQDQIYPKPVEEMDVVERYIDATVNTIASLINGGILGGIFGLITGAWKSKSFSGALAEAKHSGKNWAKISGVYSGLQNLSRAVRAKDDKFNNIIGACGSGAVFSMENGPRSMIQGCASFAMFSYFIDKFAEPPKDEQLQSEEKLLR